MDTREFIGIKYGHLTCVEFSHKEKRKGYFFKFKCDCGQEKICNLSRVRNGYIKSCGCLRIENQRKMVFKDLTGQKFNYLTVIEYVGSKNKKSMWLCECECGNQTIVDSSSLKSGNTKACGCHMKDGWGNNKTHGMSKTRLYRIWQAMISRCYYEKNKYYQNYGGRGISVCDEWRNNFELFMKWSLNNHYANNLTIDRIDNDKGYSPDNCKWVTRFVQMNNTRNNRLLDYNGQTKTVAEWSRYANISYDVLHSRIFRYHWPVDKALETPVMRRGG